MRYNRDKKRVGSKLKYAVHGKWIFENLHIRPQVEVDDIVKPLISENIFYTVILVDPWSFEPI